ncbi:MAG TPA: NAD(P)H-dependent glycerol-3-phosphate dehydrogenase [Thermoanaerobaculia bacterium]|jgi:glycerol-3-phosphate dehydrogenase (NAD(P)+)|nr:NAD(P)H-dependent glycerol-3-phosphate dehydrogenase [Thermoanaerobaculia bacterium]
MKVCVVGAGSWGTALAIHAGRAGLETVLWARDPRVVDAIARGRRHPKRHPDAELPSNVRGTADAREAARADLVVLAVPSPALPGALEAIGPVPGGVRFLSAIKGFEVETGRRVSEVVASLHPRCAFAVLSGPTFADGVVRGDPTAAVVASSDPLTAETIQRELSSESFRLYQSDDVVGVELAGGLKNVVAIAAGIVVGLGLGPNTTAALMTRGLAEITRLVLARGGREKTLSGLAGVGDLMLTCTGPQSRNRRVGERIGRGESPAEAMAAVAETAEGTRACLAASRMAAESGIEMPINEAVRRVLYEGLSPREAVRELMTRDLRSE